MHDSDKLLNSSSSDTNNEKTAKATINPTAKNTANTEDSADPLDTVDNTVEIKNKNLVLLDHKPTEKEFNSYTVVLYKYSEKLFYAYYTVLQYIKRNNRILTGGMSINYALKNKGVVLYKTLDIDYDFYSPSFALDAYTITDELLPMDEPKATHCIVALHKSTMRVRYRFRVVADVTYIPENLYNKIPTLKYNGIRFVHPCYQIIDQHLSLGRPYEGLVHMNIHSRWEKDIKRFMLLSHYYDIPKELLSICNIDKISDIKLKKLDFKIADFKDQCLCGFISWYYWINKLKNDNYNAIEFSIPEGESLTILSDNIVEFSKSESITGSPTYYNSVLDVIPRKLRKKYLNYSLDILDIKGDMISACKIGETYICGVNYTLAYLLMNAILFDNKNACLAYIELYNLLFESLKKNNNLSLIYSTEVYGNYKIGHHMTHFKKICSNIKGTHYVETNLPKNYYPEKGNKPNYAYDPTAHYHFNGLECEEFNELCFPSECDNLYENLEDLQI